MQKELGTILKNRLVDLPFIDVLAGIAQTVSITDTVGDGDSVTTTTVKRVPVSDDTTEDKTIFGQEIILIPNEGRRSIIYFEDYGITEIDYNGRPGYQANIRLIAWFNRERTESGETYARVSGKYMATIIERLRTKPVNISIFSRLAVSLARIPPQDPALFGRYTYNETQRQYLRPPFEFFGLDLIARFTVSTNCLNIPIPPPPPTGSGNTLPFKLA